MALNREEKAAVIEEVSAQVAQAGSIVLAEYRGLTVEKITQLRKQARESGVYLRVLKNTLVRRAVKDTPYEKLADQMVGPLMYGISADPVAPAKLIASFAKANDQLVVKGGAMPNVGHGRRRGSGPGHHAEPRRAAGQAAGHDAGTGCYLRSYPQRGSDEVRSRSGGRARQAGSCLSIPALTLTVGLHPT